MPETTTPAPSNLPTLPTLARVEEIVSRIGAELDARESSQIAPWKCRAPELVCQNDYRGIRREDTARIFCDGMDKAAILAAKTVVIDALRAEFGDAGSSSISLKHAKSGGYRVWWTHFSGGGVNERRCGIVVTLPHLASVEEGS